MVNAIRMIQTEADYDSMLQQIDRLMDVRAGSSEAEQLEALVALETEHKDMHYPISPPTLPDNT